MTTAQILQPSVPRPQATVLPAGASRIGATGLASLWQLAAILTVAAALSGVASMFDDRTIGHYNVWVKPMKFQLALAIQTATIAWAVTRFEPAMRRIAMPRAVSWLWLAVALAETLYITLQGARGVASHFNRSTAWEGVAGTSMAVGAGLLVLVTLWVGLAALWQARRLHWAPLPLAIGLGFVLGSLLAAWTGGAMGAIRGYWPQPLVEPVQWMPVTGWVLSQTDLRIGHFIGLHQMQLLPALVLAGAWAGWGRRALRMVPVVAGAVSVIVVSLLV